MADFRAYPTPKFPTYRHATDEAKPAKRVPRWAVIGIFLIMLSGFVIEARSFLMPVTLALLLFFVFVPFRRAMGRMGVGPSATAGIVTVGMIALVAVLGYLVSGPITQMASNSAAITQRLEERFNEIKASIKPLQDAAAKIDAVAAGDTGASTDAATVATAGAGSATVTATTPSGAPAVPEQIKVQVTADAAATPTTLERLASVGPAVGGQVMFTLVLLYFMLSSGDLLYLKIVQSFNSTADKRAAYTALRDIEDSLGAYLFTITWINAGLGAAIGIAMWAWGMPNPLLWGLAGFVLNYIPYIGAIMGTAAGVLVALLMFDGLWQPIMVGLTFLALTSIEGQFVTPIFVSRKLELNEVVVFLTVALWAFFWSILGMVVAVPMLVVLRVLAEHIPGLEKFGNFLAGDAPDIGDEDEETAEEEDEHEAEAREILEAGEAAKNADEAEVAVAEAVADDDEPAPPPITGGEGMIVVAPSRRVDPV